MCDTCKALVRVLARQSYFQEGVEVLKKSIDGEAKSKRNPDEKQSQQLAVEHDGASQGVKV